MITPPSFGHPAKFARGLIERIYRHCLEQGYLSPGDTVADPFGGVGLGGIAAAYAGFKWIGVELEPRFVHWARRNFSLHQPAWKTLNRPRPVILQGDSRDFASMVGQVLAVVSSPPYAQALRGLNANGIDSEKLDRTKHHTGQSSMLHANASYGKEAGQIEKLPVGSAEAVISSPPYATIAAGAGGLNTKPAKKPGQQTGRALDSASQSAHQRYGESSGQIAGLSEGSVEAVVSSPPYENRDLTGARNFKSRFQPAAPTAASNPHEGYSAVVTSPPWEQNCEGGRKAHKLRNPLANKRGHGASDAAVLAQAKRDEQREYGDSPGQIGQLKGGSVKAVVSSPPYGETLDHGGGPDTRQDRIKGGNSLLGIKTGYGKAQAQISGAGETYWQAVAQVYAECFKAIKPGGVIVLVVKDYVKNKQIVPLCDDTARLLEHLGFVELERIHALLTTETTHGDLFEGTVTTRRERKSFFRRLAEKKGSPPIDYEQVLIFRRP